MVFKFGYVSTKSDIQCWLCLGHTPHIKNQSTISMMVYKFSKNILVLFIQINHQHWICGAIKIQDKCVVDIAIYQLTVRINSSLYDNILLPLGRAYIEHVMIRRWCNITPHVLRFILIYFSDGLLLGRTSPWNMFQIGVCYLYVYLCECILAYSMCVLFQISIHYLIIWNVIGDKEIVEYFTFNYCVYTLPQLVHFAEARQKAVRVSPQLHDEGIKYEMYAVLCMLC